MKRTYVIKIIKKKNNDTFYIESMNNIKYINKLTKYNLGYRFSYSSNIENALKWEYKKSIKNIVKKLNNNLFEPGFDTIKNRSFSFHIEEITPKKTLRLMKIKKLFKL